MVCIEIIKLMKAKLIAKKLVAKDTLRVEFKLNKAIEFEAGQYAFLELTDKEINEPRGNRHHFTIVNPPEVNDKVIFTTRLTGSKYKQALENLPIGDEAKIDTISGNFTLPELTDKKLVFIAGGIGITPFTSMIDHIKRKNLNYKITLLYSNHDQKSTAYFKLLKKWQDQMDNLKIILTMTSQKDWPGETRRIDQDFIKDHFDKPNQYQYLIAGPPTMAQAVEKEVKKAGVEKDNIKTENFSGYEKY
jgi:ferredoxin-NADP reductase